MKTIYKYRLPIEPQVTLHIPGGSGKVVLVAEQQGQLALWVEVDTEQPKGPRDFFVVGTGHTIDRGQDRFHCGSVVMGMFVWHVYSNKP